MLQEFLSELQSGKLLIVNTSNKVARDLPRVPDYITSGLLEDFNKLTKQVKVHKIPPKEAATYEDVLFNYSQDALLNRPTQIVPIEINEEQQYLVSNYHKPLAILDNNYNFLRYWGRYYSPVTSDGFVYTKRIAVDIDKDLLVLLSETKHFIRAYRWSTGEKLWDFGVYESIGEPYEGKLHTPKDLIILPNGNILVATYYGYSIVNGEKKIDNGLIIELNGADGSYIKTHLQYTNTGYGWNGETYRPKVIKQFNDKIYIATYRDMIDVFTYKDDELVYDKSYPRPRKFGVDKIDIADFIVTDSHIIVLSIALRKIIKFNTTTYKVDSSVGYFRYEDGGYFKHQTNALNAPYSLVEKDDYYVVIDYGNNQVIKVYKDPYKTVEYELPQDLTQVIYTSVDVDDNGIAKIYKHEKAEDLYIVYT